MGIWILCVYYRLWHGMAFRLVRMDLDIDYFPSIERTVLHVAYIPTGSPHLAGKRHAGFVTIQAPIMSSAVPGRGRRVCRKTINQHAGGKNKAIQLSFRRLEGSTALQSWPPTREGRTSINYIHCISLLQKLTDQAFGVAGICHSLAHRENEITEWSLL